jgi:hypothetical protein
VKLRLNCALEVRIEERRRGRWGEMAGDGAGCDAGEGSRRWEKVPTCGPELSASERKEKRGGKMLGRWIALVGRARCGGPQARRRREREKGGLERTL